jgi:hypothetical protein
MIHETVIALALAGILHKACTTHAQQPGEQTTGTFIGL